MRIEFHRAASAALVVTGGIGILLLVLAVGWPSAWSMLLVPTLEPPFADLRTIQGALLAVEAGVDPQVSNPGDPWGRTMNYSSIWVDIARALRFDVELNFLAFAILSVAAYLVAVARLGWRSGSALVPLLCLSGASLLAMERGNNDILIFVLVALAAASRGPLSTLPVMAASALKLYPALLVPAYFMRRRQFAVLVAGHLALAALVLPQVSAIRAGTPTSLTVAYGVGNVSLAARVVGLSIAPVVIAVLTVGAVLAVSALLAREPSLLPRGDSAEDRRAFLFGGLIFTGTFLLGTNWDYRLIFLILCVPLIASPGRRIVRYPIAVLLVVAFNELALTNVIGTYGWIMAVAAKSLLAVLIGGITLSLLVSDVRTSVTRSGTG